MDCSNPAHERFGGVFDLPKECHGCLACFAELQAKQNENLAQAIAHFLYWTGWLEEHDKDNVWDIIIQSDKHPMLTIHCGTRNFDHLLAALEKQYPDWRTWNTNYRKTDVH